MSAYALNFKRCQKYPYGGYSPDGDPVCYDHREVRCYSCGELFSQHLMKRRVVGMREDRVLRHGMRPRVEEFFGSFCPQCDRRGERKKGSSEEGVVSAKSTALVLCGMFVAGFAALFWVLLNLIKSS